MACWTKPAKAKPAKAPMKPVTKGKPCKTGKC